MSLNPLVPILPITEAFALWCSVKKDVLKNFTSFPRKHLRWSLFSRTSADGCFCHYFSSFHCSLVADAKYWKATEKEQHGEEVNFLHTNCYFVITNTIGNSKLAHVSKKCPHLYVAEFPKDLASLENSSFYIDHCLLVTWFIFYEPYWLRV